ncbi:hypothetical protein EJV47_22975 [Hymenobacter gummosus]|uniref:Uncharacterized protein n=1 Tax=Hymenobacter gummosus TaxID=1776032 RepID=A0A3S0J6N2_9BACT|nr:hypothetical protein [Hymenobacter gummosus]RTQ46022.1 hypothetical protein EJV47_22975 [Hymenobacter gummosus]
MNRLFLSAAMLTYSLSASAGQEPTLNDRATTLTQQLAHKVPLNEAQFVKVRRLNLQLLTATTDLQAQFANDPATLDQRLAELQDNYDWDMAAILWPRQQLAYRQYRSNMTAMDAPTAR